MISMLLNGYISTWEHARTAVLAQLLNFFLAMLLIAGSFGQRLWQLPPQQQLPGAAGAPDSAAAHGGRPEEGREGRKPGDADAESYDHGRQRASEDAHAKHADMQQPSEVLFCHQGFLSCLMASLCSGQTFIFGSRKSTYELFFVADRCACKIFAVQGSV